MFALALSFAAQVSVFSPIMKQYNVGIVYGASGPVAGAYVSAEGVNGSAYAITDSSGYYNMTTGLYTGTYNVTTLATGYMDGQVDSVNVTAGQTTSDVNFDLQLSGGISGMVTDAVNGSGLSGTDVYAILSNGTGTFGFSGISGSDGSYLIATNLGTGMYNVSILLPPDGYITQMTTANVTVGQETNNVNLALPRSGIISGTITAPNGTGLFGIEVIASSSTGITSNYGYTTTDSAGNYMIATGLGTDNYTVYASGDGNFTEYGGILTPVSVPVTAGQEASGIDMELTPVTTPLAPSGTITGQITDKSTGNPIEFAMVSATGSGGSGSAETDSNGYYNISSGLGTGTDYNVSATASGYDEAYYPTLVSVTSGETTSNINIPMTAEPASTFGTITGTVTAASTSVIPEFQYPVIVILLLILATAVVGTVMLKTRRYKNKANPT
jgi:hypothetical protein